MTRLSKLLTTILTHPFFSLVITAVLMIASQFVPLLPNVSDRARNVATIVIGVCGLAVTWYASVNHIFTKTPVLQELNKVEERLTEKLTNQSTGALVLQAKQWNRDYINQLLQMVQPGESVRIWTTFFDDETYMQQLISDLLTRGAKVYVLLMNHQNAALVNSRFRLRPDYQTNAATKIEEGLTKLSDIRKNAPRGSLECERCDTMPFGAFFQIADRVMLVGFFLPHRTWEVGPLVRFDHGSTQWELFQEAWTKCWDNPRDKAFEEFFNSRSHDPHAPRGRIILQADFLDGLLNGWTDPKEQNHIKGKHRPFKARRWINACDTEGAEAIIELFQANKTTAPVLFLSERNERDAENVSPPFEIVMGGFTYRTLRDVNRIGHGWMRLKALDDAGDAIFLHKNLIPTSERFKGCITAKPVTTDDDNDEKWHADLLRLLPSDWDKYKIGYIEQWRKKMKDRDALDVVKDYAMILRHTEGDPPRVKFYIIGFTEVGTKAAGYYLADHWLELWQRSGHDKRHSGGHIFVLLAGSSDPYTLRQNPSWETVLTITAENLQGIPCLWTGNGEMSQSA